METSLKKNLIYNFLYQILNMLLPLVTTPYVSRTLGSSAIGRYSYSYSIASLFAMFAMLGIYNYGSREIAAVSDEFEKKSQIFWQIFTIQFLLSVIVSGLYCLANLYFFDDKKMGWVMLIYIISQIFDINWFFFGIEKFKITVSRNTFLKIFSVILIFLFVKSSSDIFLYSIIMVGSTLVSQLYLWTQILKYVSLQKIKLTLLKVHISPIFLLFIPIISISLYRYMGKVILGNISMLELGYFESSEKLVQLPIALVTAVGTVMLPRISNLISNGRRKESEQYILKTMYITLFLVSGICFGIMAVSSEFVPLFYGPGFKKCIIILQILLPSCGFMAFANIIRTQYLIPASKDKIYVLSIISGAIVNLLVNIFITREFQAIGASFALFSAEFTVFIVQCYCTKSNLSIKKYLTIFLEFYSIGFAMFLLLNQITISSLSLFTLLLIKVILGSLIYCVLTISYFSFKKIVLGSL